MMRYLLFCLLSSTLFAKIIVVPDYEGYIDTLFPTVLDRSYWDYGLWGKIKCVMTERQVDVEASSLKQLTETDLTDVDKIVVMNYPGEDKLEYLSHLPKEKLVLLVFEPPSVYPKLHTAEFFDRFSMVITWDDDLIDDEKFVKFHYPVMYKMKKEIVPFQEKKLLCMICRNKSSDYPDEIYSLRRRAIEHFENSGEFDLYGYGWEGAGLLCYQGSIPDKYKVLREYRFSLCFENTQNINGYITEKIFDCFHVGSIPVYLGASNVTDYIPKECFIDLRDFKSFDDLHQYLKCMDINEYQNYLLNIRRFLASQGAKLYTDEQFVVDFSRYVVGLH